MAKPVLGRGLSALLGGVSPQPKPSPFSAPPAAHAAVSTPVSPKTDAPPGETVQIVPADKVRPCPLQPRKDFSADALKELADSIREKGIVQPLIVRKRDGFFELIAGERRWRAAQSIGLNEVPVIVREADDRAVLELALIENLQRENLNAIEEALGYSQLIGQFQLTQEEAAAKVGKSRALVANALRLLKLDPELQAHVRDGRLSVGHAKVILGLSGAEEQQLAAERVLKDGLNVRQTENLVALMQKPGGIPLPAGRSKTAAPVRDLHVTDLENRLRERFGTKVLLRYRKGKGAVEIKFFNDDDLDRILRITGIEME